MLIVLSTRKKTKSSLHDKLTETCQPRCARAFPKTDSGFNNSIYERTNTHAFGIRHSHTSVPKFHMLRSHIVLVYFIQYCHHAVRTHLKVN